MIASFLSLGLLLAGATVTQQPGAPAETQQLHVYDVRDLVTADAASADAVAAESGAAADPEPPRLLRDLPLLGDLFARRSAKSAPSGPKVRLRAIADMLQEFVEPRLGAKDEIQTVGEGRLVVLASPEQHAWIRRWLELQRATPEQQVDVTASFYALTPAAYAACFAPLLARVQQPTQVRLAAGVQARSLLLAPGAETVAFLTALAKADGVDSVSSPRVLARMRETVDVRAGKEVAYVKDFELERTPGSVIANPVIGTVWDGLAFSCFASPLASGHLGLTLEALAADLQHPIPSVETSLGVGAPVTIQLPRVRVARVRAAVELPKDHVVVFSVADTTEKPILVVVRAQAVDSTRGAGK